MSKNTFASLALPTSAFGEWRTAGEDIWNEATVAPWRGLFENLDDLATDLPKSETPLSLADEAPVAHDETLRRLGQATALLLRAATRRQGREKHLL